MRSFKTLSLWILVALAASCGSKTEQTIDGNEASHDWTAHAVIYEVNLRHFTPEGTIAAFRAHLPRLKELGVDVLWFMPIQPIGEVKRKAQGDVFVDDVPEEERSKYLGSPYSVRDYTAVNPDYGTMQEFKDLVEECHSHGFKVVLDWVANHTGWDHAWITEQPDWYVQVDGQITDPLDEHGNSIGWTDVAELNYDAPGLNEAMVNEMRFWVDSCGIDGFRCDVAMNVPVSFWNRASRELNSIRPMFMLAESEEHVMGLYDSAFQQYYAWEAHAIMNEIAKGEKTTAELARALDHKDSVFAGKAYPMHFITNHDENAWNGTVFERMGDKWKPFAILTYALKGYPLIHTGQEVGIDHRLAFFEKDSVDWEKEGAKEFTAFYTQLNKWKDESALALDASEVRILHENGILEVQRADWTFLFNLSAEQNEVALPESCEWMYGSKEVGGSMDPWSALVYRSVEEM